MNFATDTRLRFLFPVTALSFHFMKQFLNFPVICNLISRAHDRFGQQRPRVLSRSLAQAKRVADSGNEIG